MSSEQPALSPHEHEARLFEQALAKAGADCGASLEGVANYDRVNVWPGFDPNDVIKSIVAVIFLIGAISVIAVSVCRLLKQ